MTGEFDFIAYMRNVATKLKELQHTEDEKHFTRIKGISALEEFLQNQRNLEGIQLVAVANKTGRFTESGDNLLDQPYYSFFVLKMVTVNDFDAQELAVNECEAIIKKIFSKMFREKIQPNSPLAGLQKASISYAQSGPWVHGWHGMMASFTLLDYPGIIYNADDWIDG